MSYLTSVTADAAQCAAAWWSKGSLLSVWRPSWMILQAELAAEAGAAS